MGSIFLSNFVGRYIYLGVIVGAAGDGDEGEYNDGDWGGKTCRTTEAGVSRHWHCHSLFQFLGSTGLTETEVFGAFFLGAFRVLIFVVSLRVCLSVSSSFAGMTLSDFTKVPFPGRCQIANGVVNIQ